MQKIKLLFTTSYNIYYSYFLLLINLHKQHFISHYIILRLIFIISKRL